MWSSASIAGAPRILMLDLTQNSEGWEHEFSDRLCRSLQRSELIVDANAPQHIEDIGQWISSLSNFRFNCLFLFGNAERLSTFLDSLRFQQGLSPFLLAACSCRSFDPQQSEDVLKAAPAIAPFAIAQLSSMSPREAGLFYLKFFTELKLHSADHLSGKMVWFSFSKAKELLRRRRYPGKYGVRC
jgi:hypothetical protein